MAFPRSLQSWLASPCAASYPGTKHMPCHPPASFLCSLTRCETPVNFVLWVREEPAPHCDPAGYAGSYQNPGSPRNSSAVLPGIAVKAQFWEEALVLPLSLCMGSRCPPATGHQLHSNENPMNARWWSGGTPVLRGSSEIVLAVHVLKATFM